MMVMFDTKVIQVNANVQVDVLQFLMCLPRVLMYSLP
jgi:hypothetical protein